MTRIKLRILFLLITLARDVYSPGHVIHVDSQVQGIFADPYITVYSHLTNAYWEVIIGRNLIPGRTLLGFLWDEESYNYQFWCKQE